MQTPNRCLPDVCVLSRFGKLPISCVTRNKKFSHSIILCEQYQTGGGESKALKLLNIFDLTSTASVSTRVSHCYVGHSVMMVMSPCLRVHFGLMWLTGAECITDQWSSSWESPWGHAFWDDFPSERLRDASGNFP